VSGHPPADDFEFGEEDVTRYAAAVAKIRHPDLPPTQDERSIVALVLTAVAADRRLRSPNGTPADRRMSTVDVPLPCPIRSPFGDRPCMWEIPAGRHVYEGHPGHHIWSTDRVERILAGGHFDRGDVGPGGIVRGHLPGECPEYNEPYTPCPFLRRPAPTGGAR
jgi:hypothetical protein